MIEVSYISALIGGLLTFLAPCTLPLIPAYIAFIGGGNQHGETGRFSRQRLFVNAVFFVLGFSLIFILFGMISGVLGTYLILYRSLIAQIGGVIIIFFGLAMLGVFSFPRIPPLFRMERVTHLIPPPGSRRGAFVLGLMFSLGWSPCLGPVLGAIFGLAVVSATALSGAMLLATYALGLAIPFLLVAFLYGSALTYVTALQRYLPMISRIGAACIVLIGFLLLIGQFGILNTWAISLFGNFGFDKYVELM
jgi:cytochrome c-type biogenesis protein